MSAGPVTFYEFPPAGQLRILKHPINLECDPDLHSSYVAMTGETLAAGEIVIVLERFKHRSGGIHILTSRGLKDCHCYYINRNSVPL